MTRVALLRSGYGAFGLAFAALGASFFVSPLILVGLVLALAGGALLAFSDDELPKWAGVALVAYFVVSLVAFLAATPVTIRLEFFNGFLNQSPSPLARAVFDYIVLAFPLMLGATAVAAAWEREWPPRILLLGAFAGFLLVGVLTLVLVPRGTGASDLARASSQADILRMLFAVSAGAGAVGAFWAAARPEEYA